MALTDAGPARPRRVVLDLDGTLVDSVPVHVLAWQAAFRDRGLDVPSHHLGRALGLGPERLVAAVTDRSVEVSLGEELRGRYRCHLARRLDEIVPTRGAGELLDVLARAGYAVTVTTTADGVTGERLLHLMDGATTLADLVTADDLVEAGPAAHPVQVALTRCAAHADADAGAVEAVVGDDVHDAAAARGAGVPFVGVLTGGTGSAELVDAGATATHDTPRALCLHLREHGTLLPAGGAETSRAAAASVSKPSVVRE